MTEPLTDTQLAQLKEWAENTRAEPTLALIARCENAEREVKAFDPDPVVCGCREAVCPHTPIAKLPRQELVNHFRQRIKDLEADARARVVGEHPPWCEQSPTERAIRLLRSARQEITPVRGETEALCDQIDATLAALDASPPVVEIPDRRAAYALALLGSLRGEITPVRGETAALCRAIDDYLRTGEVPSNVKLEDAAPKMGERERAIEAISGAARAQMIRDEQSVLVALIRWLDAKGAASTVCQWGDSPGTTFRALIEEFRDAPPKEREHG